MHIANENVLAANAKIRTMFDEAERLLKSAGEAQGEAAAKLYGQGMAMLECGLSEARALERKTVRTIKHVAAATDELVQANPWRTAAVSGLLGAGIGLALGLVLARD